MLFALIPKNIRVTKSFYGVYIIIKIFIEYLTEYF